MNGNDNNNKHNTHADRTLSCSLKQTRLLPPLCYFVRVLLFLTGTPFGPGAYGKVEHNKISNAQITCCFKQILSGGYVFVAVFLVSTIVKLFSFLPIFVSAHCKNSLTDRYTAAADQTLTIMQGRCSGLSGKSCPDRTPSLPCAAYHSSFQSLRQHG